MYDSALDKQIRLERLSPAYWRVTFDIQPLNIFGPQNMGPLGAIVAALETDKDVRVVVFDKCDRRLFPDPLRLSGRARRYVEPAVRPDRPAAAARRAGAVEPRARGLDRQDSRAGDRGRQRTRAGQRHAFRQSREGHSFPVGSGCGAGARRRPDGAPARASSVAAGRWKCYWAPTTSPATLRNSTAT